MIERTEDSKTLITALMAKDYADTYNLRESQLEREKIKYEEKLEYMNKNILECARQGRYEKTFNNIIISTDFLHLNVIDLLRADFESRGFLFDWTSRYNGHHGVPMYEYDITISWHYA